MRCCLILLEELTALWKKKGIGIKIERKIEKDEKMFNEKKRHKKKNERLRKQQTCLPIFQNALAFLQKSKSPSLTL